VKLSKTERVLVSKPSDVFGESANGVWDYLRYYWYSFKVVIGYYHHRNRVKVTCALFVWLGVGTVLAMYLDRWDFLTSLYFALSALSTAGLQTPACHGPDGFNCNLGDARGILYGLSFA
jgi:hypothetical protein